MTIQEHLNKKTEEGTIVNYFPNARYGRFIAVSSKQIGENS